MTEPVKEQPKKRLLVAPSPHVRMPDTTATIMYDVVFALFPAVAWGCYLFGLRAALLCILSILSAVAAEWVTEKCLHRPITVTDGSAVVTGLLIALNMPVTVPLWIPVLGSAFAIVLVKQLFGGIGKNFMNPALAGRVFLFLSFPALVAGNWPRHDVTITDWWSWGVPQQMDGITSATPLMQAKAGGISVLNNPVLRERFLTGLHSGCIGEVSAIAILIGGVYLLLRRVISWHIPVSMLGTVALLTFLFPAAGADRAVYMICQVFGGGLLFAAFFMATDYATSPITNRGRLIFGCGCGVITVLIRTFGSTPEGVSFAILVMNLLVPYIDSIAMPRRFGVLPKGAQGQTGGTK